MNCHKIFLKWLNFCYPRIQQSFYDEQIQKLYAAVGWDKQPETYTGKTQPVKGSVSHNYDFVFLITLNT